MNKTIDFFYQISNIPRPSGHEEKIRNYLVDFAKARNLEYITDEFLNVIIKKPAKTIAKKNKFLILQAHTDMVCEANKDFDFLSSPIKVIKDGDFLRADETTLGADNGIGLSMILSILDNDDLDTPNLECIFTTQEETTMAGAKNINIRNLKSNTLLSIDGSEESVIECSSASMDVLKVYAKYEKARIFEEKPMYTINVKNLLGGHSGTDISKNRHNAIKILFEILKAQGEDMQIKSVFGGGKSNAIPRECSCTFLTNAINKDEILNKINEIKNRIACDEPESEIEFVDHKKKMNNSSSLSELDTKRLVDYINSFKNGVLVYDDEDTTFPILSDNLAQIQVFNLKCSIVLSARSSKEDLREKRLKEIVSQASLHYFSFDMLSEAPFFEKKKVSYLQKLLCNTYHELFRKDATITGVHAGLEGGVFSKKNDKLDICVIAPNIYDLHSPKEKVSLESVDRVYKWLEKTVEEF